MASNPRARRPRSWPALSQPAIGSGVHPEAITDEVPQPAIPFADGVTPSAPLIGSGGVERRIAAPGQGVSAQLPRHGGFGPPHRLGDGADRTASRLQRSYDLFLHPANANSLA